MQHKISAKAQVPYFRIKHSSFHGLNSTKIASARSTEESPETQIAILQQLVDKQNMPVDHAFMEQHSTLTMGDLDSV